MPLLRSAHRPGGADRPEQPLEAVAAAAPCPPWRGECLARLATCWCGGLRAGGRRAAVAQSAHRWDQAGRTERWTRSLREAQPSQCERLLAAELARAREPGVAWRKPWPGLALDRQPRVRRAAPLTASLLAHGPTPSARRWRPGRKARHPGQKGVEPNERSGPSRTGLAWRDAVRASCASSTAASPDWPENQRRGRSGAAGALIISR